MANAMEAAVLHIQEPTRVQAWNQLEAYTRRQGLNMAILSSCTQFLRDGSQNAC